jgi:hypothetical protein
VFEEEGGNAVVGSPRGEQHILLVKCRFHHQSSQMIKPTPNARVDRGGDYIQPSARRSSWDTVPRPVERFRSVDFCGRLHIVTVTGE